MAKGADFNAVAIREHARSCGVRLVENPILARALHASCEVDDVVPPSLYAAVARLLAFVYSLSPTARVFRRRAHDGWLTMIEIRGGPSIPRGLGT